MQDVLLYPPEIGNRTPFNMAACQPIVRLFFTGQQIKKGTNNLTAFEVMISVYMQPKTMTP